MQRSPKTRLRSRHLEIFCPGGDGDDPARLDQIPLDTTILLSNGNSKPTASKMDREMHAYSWFGSRCVVLCINAKDERGAHLFNATLDDAGKTTTVHHLPFRIVLGFKG